MCVSTSAAGTVKVKEVMEKQRSGPGLLIEDVIGADSHRYN